MSSDETEHVSALSTIEMFAAVGEFCVSILSSVPDRIQGLVLLRRIPSTSLVRLEMDGVCVH